MQPMPPRRIAHLDMDAFYASVELLRYPELRGTPVVIGGSRLSSNPDPQPLSDYTGRGVVTTCNYEARKFGIHSAMPLMRARALCPDAVRLPLDFDEYKRLSRLFKAAIMEVAPQMEDRGIDEVYIDLTAIATPSQALARQLKDAVKRATGLTCSIAIAPNKLLAKIGSELDKPDGLTILTMDDLETRIWPLPPKRINGIGPKANEKLAKLNIDTIAGLAHERPEFLIQRFGKSYGHWLHQAAWGRDDRPVITESEPVSRSSETTFEGDTRDWNEIAGILVRLCKEVSEGLQRRGYEGKTIGVKVRYNNFKILTRDKTLETFTNALPAIRRTAMECLKRVPLERPIRLIGVRIGNLRREGAHDDAGMAGPQPGDSLPLF